MSDLGETFAEQVVAIIGLLFFTALGVYLLCYALYIAFWTVTYTVKDIVEAYTSKRRWRKANKAWLERRKAQFRQERIAAIEKELGINNTQQEETPK